MSRVRIYELAKEAGLKSKELADKLIALGYPIKSHSSTVDDDTAADIRRKVLGKATADIMEKPIAVKKKTIVVRKNTATVVRRRSKAQKQEIARKAEEAEQAEALEAASRVEALERAEKVDAAPSDITVDEKGPEQEEKSVENIEPENSREGVELQQEAEENISASVAAEEPVPESDAESHKKKSAKKSAN